MAICAQQIAAVVLAVKIRNVKIKAVNDAKEIAVIVYFSTIAIVESFLLGLVLQDYNNVSDALSLGHVLLAASAAVGLIFIPKVQIQFISIHALLVIQMISLWRDPHGEKVFSNEDTEQPTTNTAYYEKTKIAQLEEEIVSLKQRVKNSVSSNDVRYIILHNVITHQLIECRNNEAYMSSSHCSTTQRL